MDFSEQYIMNLKQKAKERVFSIRKKKNRKLFSARRGNFD